MSLKETIDQINTQLSKLDDGKRIRFLNINDKIADTEGKLLAGMSSDGLHLEAKGYDVWAEALQPILTEIMGPPATEDHAAASNWRSKRSAVAGQRRRVSTLLSDGLHPTSKGYEIWAEAVATTLRKLMDRDPARKVTPEGPKSSRKSRRPQGRAAIAMHVLCSSVDVRARAPSSTTC